MTHTESGPIMAGSSRAGRMAGALRSPELHTIVLAAIACGIGMLAQGNPFYINVLTSIAIYYVLAAGYNILYGYAGLVSLGHPALYAIGAYSSALLGIHFGMPWLLTVLFAAILSGLAGLIIAIPTARLHAEFLALATLALTIAVEQIFNRWDAVTGGVNGIANVPVAEIFGMDFVGGTVEFFYVTVVFAALVSILTARMLRSRLGRTLHVLRDSELAAESAGINPRNARAVAFAISGALAGVAGALFAAFILYLVPSQFGFIVMVQLLTMVLVGGSGTQAGPLIGAVFLAVIAQQAFSGFGPEGEQVAYTLTLLLLILLFRQGLGGLAVQLWQRWRRRRGRVIQDPPAVVAPAEPAPRGRAAARPRHESLDVSEVSVTFGGVHALSDVSLTVRRGQIVGLIGPNGAGKTSLVNVITGVVKASEGEVRLDEERLDGVTMFKVARRGVTRTFQHPQLSPELATIENVMLGFTLEAPATLPEQLLHLPRSIRDERRYRARARELLVRLGIGAFENAETGSCPYGVQRRVELARAIATEPDFILLDEIGAGLNDAERERMVEVLRDLVADAGPGCLLIDHNMDLIRKATDHVVVFENGQFLTEGTADEVLSDERVLNVYLGGTGEGGRDD